MAFTANLSGTAQLDDSVITAMDASFTIAVGEDAPMDQFATTNVDIGAKSFELAKYARISPATTALTETEDVTSSAMSDTKVTFTPEEYGAVITTTALANLQTGGKADLAAARLVGLNAGQTLSKLACLALDAGTNVLWGDDATGDADLAAGDIITPLLVNKSYNKLARSNVPKFGGAYVLVAHDDVLHDIRAGAAAGSWQDVNKYVGAMEIFENEIGMFNGFRFIRNNLATYADQAGAGTVDRYHSYCLGFNALGKGVSQEVTMRATGPFDKLARFVNIGWYGVLKYTIVDTDALWVLKTSSSVGANAS